MNINYYKDASFYLEKGYIDRSENAVFRVIDDIGKLFDMKKVPMGYKIHGYVPIKKGIEYIWCPKIINPFYDGENNNFINEEVNDGLYIYEFSRIGNNEFVDEILEHDEKRYVFSWYKKDFYVFIGVYKLDREKTIKENIRVWKRIDDRLYLTKLFIKK